MHRSRKITTVTKVTAIYITTEALFLRQSKAARVAVRDPVHYWIAIDDREVAYLKHR
jgi:hypothetical protein